MLHILPWIQMFIWILYKYSASLLIVGNGTGSEELLSGDSKSYQEKDFVFQVFTTIPTISFIKKSRQYGSVIGKEDWRDRYFHIIKFYFSFMYNTKISCVSCIIQKYEIQSPFLGISAVYRMLSFTLILL